METTLRIHIVGAGIAGLTTAIALRLAGFNPVLHEQSAALGDVGAGITLGPNAARVLMALGLEQALNAHTWTPRHAGILHHQSGQALSLNERGARYEAEFGAPFWHIHRADLLSVLADALDLGGNTPIHFEHQLGSLSEEGGEAVLSFENGDEAAADLVIACDGIKSRCRDLLFESSPPGFTGCVAWRGLVPRRAVPDIDINPDFALYVGPGAMAGRYAVRGRSLINVVAIGRQQSWCEEGWMVRAPVSELADQLAGWHDDLLQIIGAMPEDGCFKWALHSREPLKSWVCGRVALLGDAAHPMTPFLGLGAGIGIEDAMVLARACADSDSWAQALQRYEQARRPHATHAQQESSRQGLLLLTLKPGQPEAANLTGEDPLGLYGYDAVKVAI